MKRSTEDTAVLVILGFFVLICWAAGGFESAVAAFLGIAVGSIINHYRKNEGDE